MQHTNALNRAMNRGVTQALADVDVVLFVIEADRFGGKDKIVLNLLPEDKPVILVINKMDRVKDKAAFVPFLTEVAGKRSFPPSSRSVQPTAGSSTNCLARSETSPAR